MESVLKISKIGFPVWSLRGCQQKLFPIRMPELRRTINGVLLSLVPETHQKYATIITCQDKQTPALEGLWIGDAVTVSSIQPLVQNYEGNHIKLTRNSVENSIQVFNTQNQPVSFRQDGQELYLDTLEKGYVTYRPILEMRLKNFHLHHKEWDLENSWQLDLEEI